LEPVLFQRVWQRLRRWLRLPSSPDNGLTLYPLLIRYNGNNVTVTNRGSDVALYLADQPLPTQQAWTWPPEQELRYADFILVWEKTKESIGWLQRRTLLLIVLGLIRFSTGNLMARYSLVATPIAQLATAPNATATATGTPTPTGTSTPTPTGTSTATATPARISALKGTGIAVTFTPTPTNTLAPAAATLAAARAVCTDTTPQTLDDTLVQLQVQVKPTCVKVDEYYWRLTKAEWRDEAASNGMHHVFVYLFDPAGQPVQDESITMSWGSGECTREVKDASGANCPMFSPGLVYSVQANGLPSEKVINLGLGTVELRNWAIRTSFVLTFQKTKR